MNDEDDAAAALLKAPRMTDMLSRTAVDLETMMEMAPQLIDAARACSHCRETQACDTWTAHHAEGENHAPPVFCPNAELMRAFKPKRPDGG